MILFFEELFLLENYNARRIFLKTLNLIKRNKEIILDLTLNDFSTKYAGSYFGIFWAFFQPLITILVYWCVFEFGLKAQTPIPNSSYIAWFATGMVPWFFFSEGLNAVTNSLLEYSYLVKKVVFDVELLPIIKVISALFVHLVFVVLLLCVAIISNGFLSICALQLVYYIFATTLLVYALGRITSAIILFFRDLGQIVNIILQIGVWATPIIWSYTIIPEQYRWIAKLNPVFYIVEGYRESLIGELWFWYHPKMTFYFWGIIIILLCIGNWLYRLLKPQFADVI